MKQTPLDDLLEGITDRLCHEGLALLNAFHEGHNRFDTTVLSFAAHTSSCNPCGDAVEFLELRLKMMKRRARG